MSRIELSKGAVKRTYRDARELITVVKEVNKSGIETIWTSYAYDPLKQITQVVDDKSNTTTISYDNLGRRTVIENPDTGRTETQYDTASNVTAKITANLRSQSKSISYSYVFNRLSSITYPNFPGNNVTYAYGLPGAAFNTAGRITRITSQMGTEERQYGKLGEMVYEKKTVNTFTDPLHPSVFETRFLFDTFGRMLRITYPDGEILTNIYDSGGNLQSSEGVKAQAANGQNHRYRYLLGLFYDKFEQRVFVEQGNGVKTAYSYDAKTRRLNNLTAQKNSGELFQNLAYSYDKVGNILGLANNVAVPPPNVFGGPTSQSFAYDELYRLTHAEGTFQFSPTKSHTYAMDMVYDTIHNIAVKNQLHTIIQPSQQAITQKKTSYNFAYAYNPSGANSLRPHAPTHIDLRTYTYDLDGNQTGWTHDTNGTRRTITWDDENRIQNVADNGQTKDYKYDDKGDRMIKRGPQGETVYVNQFFTQRPGATGTKHIYAGTSRIASKLVRQDTPNSNPNGNTPFEKDLYFFHPDHIGSTNYVTDLNGKLYEHLEYFPFGEAWVEENSNQQRTPFLFTAKELDEETGLYYFGARYYDPRTSVWQSTDPILDKYLDGVVNRKTFSSDFAMYTYGRNNPVALSDPDGRYTPPLPDTVYAINRSPLNLDYGHFGKVRSGGTQAHAGVDLNASVGTAIRAIGDARVAYVREGNVGDFGRTVVYETTYRYTFGNFLSDLFSGNWGKIGERIRRSGTEVYVLNAHLSSTEGLKKGDPIAEGGTVGRVGTTGNAQGISDPLQLHTHSEVFDKSTADALLGPKKDNWGALFGYGGGGTSNQGMSIRTDPSKLFNIRDRVPVNGGYE